jgi:hypothetical protein
MRRCCQPRRQRPDRTTTSETTSKYIQFTASVSNINSSGITFGDVTSKFSFTQVSCHLEDENAVLCLAKGKPATVRGIVDDDQLLGVIRLNQCEVVGASG